MLSIMQPCVPETACTAQICRAPVFVTMFKKGKSRAVIAKSNFFASPAAEILPDLFLPDTIVYIIPSRQKIPMEKVILD